MAGFRLGLHVYLNRCYCPIWKEEKSSERDGMSELNPKEGEDTSQSARHDYAIYSISSELKLYVRLLLLQ